MTYLLHNLLRFGRVLRGLGLDVQAGGMLNVAHALEYINVGRREEFRTALRSLLVHRAGGSAGLRRGVQHVLATTRRASYSAGFAGCG